MRRRARLVALSLVALSTSNASAVELIDCSDGGYPIVQNAANFEDIVGNAGEVFDPTEASGPVAYSNGDTLGPVIWRSLTVAQDIDLKYGNGSSTGLSGTLFVDGVGAAAGGFGGKSTVADDDDYELTFRSLVLAAGIEIIDNYREDGERVDFVDDRGTVVASAPLPGSTSGTGGSGFVGAVACPGERSLRAIVVREGQTRDDDTSFRSISYQPGCEIGVSCEVLAETEIHGSVSIDGDPSALHLYLLSKEPGSPESAYNTDGTGILRHNYEEQDVGYSSASNDPEFGTFVAELTDGEVDEIWVCYLTVKSNGQPGGGACQPSSRSTTRGLDPSEQVFLDLPTTDLQGRSIEAFDLEAWSVGSQFAATLRVLPEPTPNTLSGAALVLLAVMKRSVTRRRIRRRARFSA